jgi:hypothetical protein
MSDSEDEATTEHQLKFVLVGDGTAGKVETLFRTHVEFFKCLHFILHTAIKYLTNTIKASTTCISSTVVTAEVVSRVSKEHFAFGMHWEMTIGK